VTRAWPRGIWPTVSFRDVVNNRYGDFFIRANCPVINPLEMIYLPTRPGKQKQFPNWKIHPSLSSVNQRTFNKGHGWATSRSVTIITKGYLLASSSLAHDSRSCARIEATGTAGATWGKTCQLLRFVQDIWYFVDEIRCDIYLWWFEMIWNGDQDPCQAPLPMFDPRKPWLKLNKTD
jgi:hypothetical protein